MSRDIHRKGYYNRDPRNRDPRSRDWDRDRSRNNERDRERVDYRSRPTQRNSRSPRIDDKRRSRSPRKNEKDLDDNILSEISKLPEPSELWENQFQDGGFAAPPPPGFGPGPDAILTPNFGSNYQPPYSSGIYDDFPSVPVPGPVTTLAPDIGSWNQMSLPPPPEAAPTVPTAPAPFISTEDQKKKEAAIESEMRHQKAALSKQREDYIRKSAILKKELDTLRDQRNELRGDPKRSPSPDTKRFLKENTKLQLEIQNKLKTINNVVDMLNGIIGEEAQMVLPTIDESPDKGSKRKPGSPSSGQKFNYVYYDPEMHWCRVCNDFPPTAKDYLNHLHSPAHQKMAAAHLEAPWHGVAAHEGFPSHPAAPAKRTPIRGLQFFVPSTAWYCKLCDQFIGDLHCASAHLKSIQHSKNYTNFVEQNPHWETDWMSDRQKAFEKARANKAKDDKAPYTAHTITFNKDGFHTKRSKESPPPNQQDKKKKEKKKKNKKKRSSSTSSSSSSSDSESNKRKKKKKRSLDEATLSQWVTALRHQQLGDDKRLISSIKQRIKQENAESEKRRSAERSRERSPSASRKNRSTDRRTSPTRDTRDTRDARDTRDTRDRERHREERDRERERRDSPTRADAKKPEIKKMPFIGKMPVYKSLGKTKAEEIKKEEQKKKEEEESSKKRREEMDAEIQKKVAEFKEKIAKAQLDRQSQVELPPPAVALPTRLAAPPPTLPTLPTPVSMPQPTQPAALLPTPGAPALPKDFQEALDIIFPKEVKPDLSQGDLFGGLAGLPPPFPMGLGGVMPPFPPFLQPQMPQMPGMMMGFDIFPSRSQLYDTHVPLVPNKPRKRPDKKNNQQNNNKKKSDLKAKNEANGEAAKKKEEMDDLAMLGIDASDVGSGM